MMTLTQVNLVRKALLNRAIPLERTHSQVANLISRYAWGMNMTINDAIINMLIEIGSNKPLSFDRPLSVHLLGY